MALTEKKKKKNEAGILSCQGRRPRNKTFVKDPHFLCVEVVELYCERFFFFWEEIEGPERKRKRKKKENQYSVMQLLSNSMILIKIAWELSPFLKYIPKMIK